ncbi:BnaCnng43400D, partial [Brassica napus]
SSEHVNITDPKALASPPIPPCVDKFYAKLPCYDFVWSGNQSRRVSDIASLLLWRTIQEDLFRPTWFGSYYGLRRFLIGDPKFGWSFGFKEFAHQLLLKT